MPPLLTTPDLDRIAEAVGPGRRVLYEDVHVYPLSAPSFATAPRAERQRPTPGPLRLYVHVPFCNYACRFCFYAKRIGAPRAQMERYVAALARELETMIGPETPLAQLYVGGGTPTALPADLLDAVLAAVQARTRVEPGAALTVECSPESLTDAHVDVLRRRGVNRVSMGIQSLDDDVLVELHRRHGVAASTLAACDRLTAGGFFVNVDLIYGLPGQSEESFCADLESVTEHRPHSLTLYNLRLNEHTPLANVVADLDRLDLAALVRWRTVVRTATRALGYTQTRWHTFVAPHALASSYDRAPCVDGFDVGRQLGVGMSAVSHLGHSVYRNAEGFDTYVRRIEAGESPVDGVFPLGSDDRRTLFIARSLGDGRSLDRRAYAAHFGRAIEDDFGPLLARLAAAGLTADAGDGLRLTDGGRLVYDLVLLQFYPAHAQAWLDAQQRIVRGRAARA
jgi:oxygen-independent coproporphyrinogen III oxidase